MTHEQVLSTMLAIVKMPSVKGFKAGITYRFNTRVAEYRNFDFKHVVALQSDMTAVKALNLEEYLFDCTEGKLATWGKKAKQWVSTGHRKSLGGKKAKDSDRYVVYVAWW